MTDYRLEYDSIGEIKVEKDAYYGANSLRAKENFQITGYKSDLIFIKAIVEIKKACAIENEKVDLISKEKKEAIVEACDELLNDVHIEDVIVDPIQGGAGTSFNMNVNEVIANIANVSMGGELGVYDHVHPNDDVNKGQSTNDV
ncbi:MAG: lyase family protein, partial [Peptoniphilaceae bacterium]|nr:lyase family protein [Peptoniphilaceae bacterium]